MAVKRGEGVFTIVVMALVCVFVVGIVGFTYPAVSIKIVGSLCPGGFIFAVMLVVLAFPVVASSTFINIKCRAATIASRLIVVCAAGGSVAAGSNERCCVFNGGDCRPCPCPRRGCSGASTGTGTACCDLLNGSPSGKFVATWWSGGRGSGRRSDGPDGTTATGTTTAAGDGDIRCCSCSCSCSCGCGCSGSCWCESFLSFFTLKVS